MVIPREFAPVAIVAGVRAVNAPKDNDWQLVVGFGDSPQQVPISNTPIPPVDVRVAPRVAEELVIEAEVGLVRMGIIKAIGDEFSVIS